MVPLVFGEDFLFGWWFLFVCGFFVVVFFVLFSNTVGIRTAASFPFAVHTREMCLVLSGRNSLTEKNYLWTVLSPK